MVAVGVAGASVDVTREKPSGAQLSGLNRTGLRQTSDPVKMASIMLCVLYHHEVENPPLPLSYGIYHYLMLYLLKVYLNVHVFMPCTPNT